MAERNENALSEVSEETEALNPKAEDAKDAPENENIIEAEVSADATEEVLTKEIASDEELFETTDEKTEEAESEDAKAEEEPEEFVEEKPRQMTEEELLDARYLPRESVIYDENASDAIPAEEEKFSAPDDESGEMYSLPFFEEETPEIKEEIPEKKEEDEPYNPDKPRKVDVRFDFVELFVFTLALVLFITSFLIRHSVVVGGSMENTLYEGERLLISDLFYTPDYEDIIVFQDPDTNLKGAIVKRVIGLPGDTIKITSNGSIFRNGTLLIEEYVYIDVKNYQYPELETIVPEGKLFVMGDHRNKSEDSRSFGCIDEDSILGRVLLRFYPFARFGTVD